MKVDISHDRDGRTGNDMGQRLGRLRFVARAPNDVASVGGQRIDLSEGRLDIRRFRGRHRLHRNGRVTSDRNRAHLDLAGLAPRIGRELNHLLPPGTATGTGDGRSIETGGCLMSRYREETPTVNKIATTAQVSGTNFMISAR